MTDRHKTAPLSIRLPDAERDWLYNEAERTGLPVRRIILRSIRAQMILPTTAGPSAPTT